MTRNINVKVVRRGLRYRALYNHEQLLGMGWTRRGALKNADLLVGIFERFLNIRVLDIRVLGAQVEDDK